MQERGQEREMNGQMGNGLRPFLLICLFFSGGKENLLEGGEKGDFEPAANDIQTAL